MKPGQIHTDLLAAKVIEEPYNGFNVDTTRWIPLSEWTYIKTFEIQQEKVKLEIQNIKSKHPHKKLLVIANKTDAISKEQLAKLQATIPELIALSAKEKTGIELLTNHLTSLVQTGALQNNESIVTNSRHYDALLKALNEINKVDEAMELGVSGDLLAIDIREALYFFGLITGEVTTDDLLGNIFANFCIGK